MNEDDEIIYDTDNSIIFEDYLDLLLNKNKPFHGIPDDEFKNNVKVGNKKWEAATKLEQYEYIHYQQNNIEFKDKIKPEGGKPDVNHAVYTGGLKLPKTGEHVGSGNIVILGNPGAGKSTLAFMIAAACVSDINKGISVYYSLEVTPKGMIDNMIHKQESTEINFAKTWFYLPKEDEHDDPDSDKLCEWLEDVLRGTDQSDISKDGVIKPQILFPAMSPRGLAGSGEPHRLFLDRYAELELMLRAIKKFNEKKEKPENEPYIKVVVLDSLNAFGDCPLSREELFRLFDLFHHYGILGVFTLENSEIKAQDESQLTSEIVRYMSDVVISLEKEVYNSYTCLYFEVEKSRYVPQVIGKHPYKIAGVNIKSNSQQLQLRKRVEIMPSLHYRIFASEAKLGPKENTDNKNDVKSKKVINNLFGINALDDVLPNHFRTRSMRNPQIITVEGNSGLYKSDIALNALFAGILFYWKEPKNDPKKGLIIRMNDRSLFSLNGMRLNTCVLKKLNEFELTRKTHDGYEIPLYEKKDIQEEKARSEHKYSSSMWSFEKEGNEPQLIEIAFKSGALLPEEFIEEVCHIIKKYDIKRVVFADIKTIGVSYPFLINSKTSGNIFLPAFIHIMRNYGVHVIMSCSTSRYKQSDDEVHKTSVLSDAVISIKEEYEKEKDIVIVGEGLVTNKEEVIVGLASDLIKTLKNYEIEKKDRFDDVDYEKGYFFSFKKYPEKDSENDKEPNVKTNPLIPFAVVRRYGLSGTN
jgi:KaiC/GvpD/RAD55 family RecA-like ATPase